MLIADLPEARGVGIGRHALKHQARRAIGQWSVHDIGVSGDPADISRAPVHIILFQIEDIFMRHRRPNQIAARCVEHAFGLSC